MSLFKDGSIDVGGDVSGLDLIKAVEDWGLRLVVTMEMEIRGSDGGSASTSRARSSLPYHFERFLARHPIFSYGSFHQRASESSEPFAILTRFVAYTEAIPDSFVLQKT